MQDQDAKSNVLQQIIEMMSQHQMGGLKKKGESPAIMALDIKAAKPDEPAALPDEGKDDSESPDMLKALMDMYSKKDDEEDTKG